MVAMAGRLPYLQHKVGRSCGLPQNKLEEPHYHSASWYYSKKEIEEKSPSRKDGIDLRKETYLRKLYCSFLHDLGITLKVPQITIATAIMFCHRFFLGQSHVKNDWQTVATTCMFLAGKVEETPVPLREVILVAHAMIHKSDPVSAERIKRWEIYQKQKELILLAERLLLSTIGFDVNIIHPYKPLIAAIQRLNLGQSELTQVAWNIVNDCLQTTLCLQFKPHYLAAGAMFLAAKVTHVKLPSSGDKVWWQEFDVSPFLLEDVIKQMVELFIPNGSSFAHPHLVSCSKPLSRFNTAGKEGFSNLSEKSSHEWEHPVCLEILVESTQSEVQPCENVCVENRGSCVKLSEDGSQQKQDSDQHSFGEGSEMWIGVEISGVNKGTQKFSVNVISDADKERIRSTLTRRRERCPIKQAAVITNEEESYDAWIEKELEDGIELMVQPARQKLRHDEPIFNVQTT